MVQAHEMNQTQKLAFRSALKKAHADAVVYVDEWLSHDPHTTVNRAKLSSSVGHLDQTIKLIGLERLPLAGLIGEFNDPKADEYEVAQRMIVWFQA